MKKGDRIIIFLVAAAFLLSAVTLILSGGKGNRVVVKQNGNVIYNESINKNKTVTTKTNVIVIKDGKVCMETSSCKNQICVNTGEISKKGESIICLPNQITVEIK